MIKKGVETFSDKTDDFIYHNLYKVREIHRKNLKIEDFRGNFHRYNGKHTNRVRM